MKFKEFNQQIDPILCSAEFEDDGWIRITNLQYSEASIFLRLTVNLGWDLGHEYWIVTAQEVKEEYLKLDWANDIDLSLEHPLILPYLEDSVDLFLNAEVNDPAALGIEIYDVHQNFYRGISTPVPPLFTREMPDLLQLCGKQSTLFAKGPTSIITQYAEVVSKHGGCPTTVSFARRRNQQNVDKGLSILLAGRSYIIAESFDFVRRSSC